jgi:hypothetical protein
VPEDFLDRHALHTVPKLLAVDLVTIAEEIGVRVSVDRDHSDRSIVTTRIGPS